jgi:uncharacterized protein (TIRG00374 family)
VGDALATGSTRRARWFAVLRALAGLAVLAFVAARLPWRDRLAHDSSSRERQEVSGTIEGEWTSERIGFRVAADARLDETWPDEVLRAHAAGQSVAIQRGGALAWQPGMLRVFRGLAPRSLLAALALLLVGHVIVVTRWWRLLCVAGVGARWWDAFRLAFLGLFFNLVVPGLTGGDVVKAVLVAKENPGKRADALVSVAVDRLVGLLALAFLAATVLFFAGQRFAALRWPLALSLGGALLAVLLYANGRLRRALRFETLVARLPLGARLLELDRAALLYFRQPLQIALGVVLSLANHAFVVGACMALGAGFGIEEQALRAREWFVVVPLANIASALPLTPGGWGVGEAAFQFLFEQIGASGVFGVAVSLTFRLCHLALGLLGGAYLLLPATRAAVGAARGSTAGAERG